MPSIETTLTIKRDNRPENVQTTQLAALTYITTEERDKLGLGAPAAPVISDSGGGANKTVVIRWTYPQANFESRFPTQAAQIAALGGVMAARVSMEVPCEVVSEVVTYTP